MNHMDIKIHNHASVVLAYMDRKILSNLYDETYPKEIWRNRINLIGGAQSQEDKSPRELLYREICEEFSLGKREADVYDSNVSDIIGDGQGAPIIQNFAPKEEIDAVKNSILSKINPYSDFLVSIPAYRKKPQFQILFSVYSWEIPEEILKVIERNINQGKSLVNEGFLTISDLEGISQGTPLTAWGTGLILEDFFKINVPNKDGVSLKKLGFPKDSFKEYREEFYNTTFP